MSPETARSILALEFSESDHTRMAELSGKAQSGTLSADENEELGDFLCVADMLAILKLNARRSLDGGASV